MKPMIKTYIKRLSLLILGFGAFQVGTAQNVLIIYDDSPTNTNTVALKNALDNAGYPTTISSVSETSWNNTNPSLAGFDVVIHLNGTTFGTEMPTAGQQALVDFVDNNGGLYVGFAWSDYEYDAQGNMQDMEDLILFQYTSGVSATTFTLSEVTSQSAHPVLANVPSSFSVNSAYSTGGIRSFSSDPSTVLMTLSSNDAVAIREWGDGCILGFSSAGNYQSGTILSDTNLQSMVIDFIGYCGFCGVTLTPYDSAASCFGYSDGLAGVIATGGAGGYTYEWNTGDTVSELSGIMAGSYTVTVLDAGGCQTVKSMTVEQPGAIYTDVQIHNFVNCNGGADGSATVNVTGGTPPFTYNWSNGETTATAVSLPAGSIISEVTDSLGCAFTDTVLINEPTAIAATYDVTGVDCDGDIGGGIILAATGGVAPYSYQWSNGATLSFLNNIENGVYNLTITDNVGCVYEDSVVVPHTFLNPAVDLGEDRSICVDFPIQLSAGNAGSSYLWSTGSQAQSITVGYAGELWVEVTNGDGCTGVDTVVIATHTCLGVDEIQTSASVALYPNPTNGLLNVATAQKSLYDVEVVVFDVMGHMVQQVNAKQISPNTPVELDLSELASGSYVVKLTNEIHQSVHSVIVR